VCKDNLSSSEGEESVGELLRFFELRGRHPLEMARQAILNETSAIESVKVREALRYFMMDYWEDLARPTLLSVCCESVGGVPASTVPFAVSLSVLSGGIDIHDDIIDESKRKHGRDTVYGKYGKEIALLTADALFFKGFALLHEACAKITAQKAQKIMETVKCLFYELGDAEALEFEIRGRRNVTPEGYLRIIEKKAADVEAHTRIGALLGNATIAEEEALARFGRLLGMIIVIRDDIVDSLDVRETKRRLEKENMPLPLVYALKGKSDVNLCGVSSDKMLRDFRKDIEKGVEQSYSLVNELAKQASINIKDLEVQSDIKKVLKALSLLTVDAE